MAETTGYMPPNKVANDVYLKDFYVKNPNNYTAVKQLPLLTKWYAFPGDNGLKITDVIKDHLNSIVTGTRTKEPDAVLADMTADVQKLLPKIGRRGALICATPGFAHSDNLPRSATALRGRIQQRRPMKLIHMSDIHLTAPGKHHRRPRSPLQFRAGARPYPAGSQRRRTDGDHGRSLRLGRPGGL